MTAIEPSVFVVDDDPAMRRSMLALLSAQGIRAETYPSGREFLAAFDPQRPGCVVLDLNMPGTSGWRFRAMQLRDRAIADVPVIALSGHGGLEQQAQMMTLDGWVGKPLDFDKLLAIVGRTCRVAA